VAGRLRAVDGFLGRVPGGKVRVRQRGGRDASREAFGPDLAGPVENLIIVKTGTKAGKPTISWERDHDAIAATARTDGIYALATNLSGKRLTAGNVLRTYKGQQIIERRHRDYKQTLKVRPIFLHNDDRIYALTSIIGIALLIFGLIEAQLRKRLHEPRSCIN
jgi:transposase